MTRDPLRARRALIVAPHPDDEAIGAWALIRTLRRRGAAVEVIVVSDGAASHPGSASWPRARLAAERRRETRRAMATLAVPPSAIRFLGRPDGALATDAGLFRALVRAIRRPAGLIVGPIADDAHADHAAVAVALARLPRRGERRLGYRVWPEGAGRAGAAVRVPLDGAAMARKRRAVRGYRTQAGLIRDSATGFAMTARHLRVFVRPVERFVAIA